METDKKSRCGDCVNFDQNTVNGSPVGTVYVDGSMVAQGYCRGRLGLVLGILNENMPCRQVIGIFRPKSSSSTVTLSSD